MEARTRVLEPCVSNSSPLWKRHRRGEKPRTVRALFGMAPPTDSRQFSYDIYSIQSSPVQSSDREDRSRSNEHLRTWRRAIGTQRWKKPVENLLPVASSVYDVNRTQSTVHTMRVALEAHEMWLIHSDTL